MNSKKKRAVTAWVLSVSLGLVCAESGFAFQFPSLKKAATVEEPVQEAQTPASAPKPAEPPVDWEKKFKDLEKKHEELRSQHDKLQADRDNVLAQTRIILREKNELAEKMGSPEALKEEKKILENELSMLRQVIDQKEADVFRVTANLEKERIRSAALEEKLNVLPPKPLSKQEAKEQEKKKVRQLREERDELRAERKTLKSRVAQLEKHLEDIDKRESRELAKTQKELKKLKEAHDKLEQEMEETHTDLRVWKEDYAFLEEEKRDLEDEMERLPKRFSDIARQNEKLIEETSDMHYNLGVYYSQSQEYELALKEFLKALELKPDDPNTHYNLGYIYAEQVVERSKALEHFERFLDLSPNDKDAEWVRRYLLTWQTYYGKEIVK